MIELVYTPKWFNGTDILIDIVSIVVLSLISLYAIQYYRLDKTKKNHLFLAISFALMAGSFLFKILTNFTIYYSEIETKIIGLTTLTYNTVEASNALFLIGFLLYRILMLLGLLTLYTIYSKSKGTNTFMIIFLLLVTTYFTSNSYYIFHTTAFLFLLFITIQYWRSYKKEKRGSNRLLMWSFGLIALSQVFFVFIRLENWLYVLSEIVQLIGYALLLITFIKVLKDGKKARKKRYRA